MADQVSAQWVVDIRREDMARSMHGEDASQPTDGAKPRSEVNVSSVLTELNVVPPGSEQPAPSSVAPTVDAAGPVQ